MLLSTSHPFAFLVVVLGLVMKSQGQIPVRVLTHNIRYATTSPFTGEKPWTDRRQLLLNELYFNTLYNPESFICLQEVLHQQVVDIMSGLNKTANEWDYIGVGRDDGKQAGEYSPIVYRPKIWKLESWKSVWLSQTPDKPSKGWDAASIRILTVGTFQHVESKRRIAGMCTHLDDQGEKSRSESAKLILKVVDQVTASPSSGTDPLPVFLGGDLNSELSGSAYQILNAKNSTLQNVADLAGVKYGDKNTHPMLTVNTATDYTLANPDTLTKYKVAAQISQKVLQEVTGWCVEGASIVELCERGDKLLEEEVSKVYKGKKVAKGVGHCTTVSPSSYITPYTPLKTDAEEAATTLKAGECVKIQLGAQIDGFPAIVCDSVVVPAEKGAGGEVEGREADLLLATYYANELLLRLMIPPGLVASGGDEEEQKKSAARKPYTQTQITQMLEKIVKAYDCNLVESTTIWLFEHNEIEAKKKIILAPGEGVRGEGLPEVGEVWGVEMGVSLGSGKVKTLSNRATLHRRTATHFGLKRPTSRAMLSEVVKKFGTFPFSLRQLEDEKAAKVGVVECVRGGVLRAYEVVGDKNNDPVARLFTTVAITKNGLTRLAAPPTPDLSKYKTDKKIMDEEILKILEQPTGKTASKNKNKKKKKKTAKKAAESEEEESDDEEPLHANKSGRTRSKCELKIFYRTARLQTGSFVAMAHLRKRKSSRNSTPHLLPDGASPTPEPMKIKTQRSLDSWIEPPLKNPTPSFEDHGFARHGVLETMAPLGTPPSAKARQRARALAEPTARRSLLGRNGNGLLGEEGVSTPEMTPAPEVEQDGSDKPEDEEMATVLPTQDEDEDDEYVPKKSKGTPKATKAPARSKTPVEHKTPLRNSTPKKNGVSVNSANMNKMPTPARDSASQATPPTSNVATRQRIQIAVNDAVARSNANHRQNVGIALRKMHDESLHDSRLAAVLESVIHQTSTPVQFREFCQYIKKVKNRVKAQAKKRGLTVTRETSLQLPSASPAITARASETATPAKAKAAKEQHPSKAAVPPPSAPLDLTMSDEPTYDDSTAVAYPVQAPPHPLTNAPALTSTKSPSQPASRMPSKSPTKQHAPNGEPASEADAAPGTGTGTSTKAATPNASSPYSGDVTDSELSDVNEEIVQNGPPPQLQANGNGATAPMSKKGRNAALARAGKKSRANSAKPNWKNEKKQPPTAQDLAQEEELIQKRQEMADRQPSRMNFNPPVSDIRFEDEIHETESITSSQYALGPPVDSKAVRRVGRPPRVSNNHIPVALGKRMREDESRQPSPQINSARPSRPTTPAIPGPAAKRLKLTNGQSARTKRSPVKNRDGPIAGIPHTGGGGGLRPLGPDDNEPSSPLTDNDDYCAACKGTGEFLCCDGCPRSFHFLCCDPPRIDAPEGSFYCQECEARQKRVDDSTEVFSPLSPLFKKLEATNTRSFALPAEIQNFFDGVAAREDGSYSEVVKKFPLSKSSGYGYQKPDYTKSLDANHKAILCVKCCESTGTGPSVIVKRPMLQCDFCQDHWHLDCLDPPLANPPFIGLEATTRDAWKCPRHIDHDYRSGQVMQHDLNALNSLDVEMQDAPSVTRVYRKVRKPKNPTVYEPTFSRGIRNNGIIEVINDENDDTDGEGNYVFRTAPREGLDEETDQFAKLFRVPEKGIMLDFIEKVKSSRIAKQKAEKKSARAAAKAAAKRKASLESLAARPIATQQAALHLVQYANKEQDIGLTETNVQSLILGLTAEAPNDVVHAISDAGPGPITDEKRAELLKLQQLIARALGK
ncbi:hypothetical protein BCR34DRAFT_481188 [Clohesyomyces aquaticus]|uniref:PHD-type domain-containing protein n=1 Tax=Clohesyomyces aquaticus TaxID=1231657 RepID=A0A1Y1ZST5_9PLEO|nr:hypothetical protein BCR34DRAFT_481188 [Clohesyomyces aquaticus]